LRTGDTVSGSVRAPKEGERYFALLKVEQVNFQTPEQNLEKVPFDYLTPLYPNKKLNLEYQPTVYSTRIIDMMVPLGKGLRKDHMDKGNWGLPGGHLDVGETLEECAVREVEEETGLKAVSAVQFASVEQPITLSEKHYLHFGYIIKDFVPGELINGEPDDIDHWV
jgi:hypothetical protein